MNIVPLSNNALITGAASNSLNLNTSAQSNASSSKDVASASQIPSVNVTLSTQANASAVVSAAIPPIYSRVSIGASTSTQLAPSRNSVAPNSNQASGAKSTEVVQAAQTSDANSNAKSAEVIQNNGNSSSSNAEKNTQISNSNQKNADSSSSSANQPQSSQSSVSGANPAKDVTSASGFSDQEIKQISALQLRDQEVKSHELAHKSVGGQFTGSISLSYQSGPDGKRYAIGGEVPIDVSPVNGDPQATIAKMNIVRAAATAPIDPSAQDQRVAAVASGILTQALSDLVQENRKNAAITRETKQAVSDAQQSNAPDPVSVPKQDPASGNQKSITIGSIV